MTTIVTVAPPPKNNYHDGPSFFIGASRMKPLFRKKISGITPLIGLFVLGVSIAFILFGGSGDIKREAIEQHLRQFAAGISAAALSDDKEAKFSYSAVDIEGWGFNKHAVVNNVVLDVSDKQPDAAHWTLTTPQVQVLPDPASGGIFFVFAEP